MGRDGVSVRDGVHATNKNQPKLTRLTNSIGGVDIISISPEPCSSIELFSIKYTRRMNVDRNFQLSVTLAEAQTSSLMRFGIQKKMSKCVMNLSITT